MCSRHGPFCFLMSSETGRLSTTSQVSPETVPSRAGRHFPLAFFDLVRCPYRAVGHMVQGRHDTFGARLHHILYPGEIVRPEPAPSLSAFGPKIPRPAHRDDVQQTAGRGNGRDAPIPVRPDGKLRPPPLLTRMRYPPREEGCGTPAGGRIGAAPGGGRPQPGLGARAGRLSGRSCPAQLLSRRARTQVIPLHPGMSLAEHRAPARRYQ